jgi:hypothetical protein
MREQSGHGTTIVSLWCGHFAGARYNLGLLSLLLPRLKTYLVPWVAGGKSRVPLVDGRDLGSACVLAATAEGLERFESFDLGGPSFPTMWEVLEFRHAEIGIPGRTSVSRSGSICLRMVDGNAESDATRRPLPGAPYRVSRRRLVCPERACHAASGIGTALFLERGSASPATRHGMSGISPNAAGRPHPLKRVEGSRINPTHCRQRHPRGRGGRSANSADGAKTGLTLRVKRLARIARRHERLYGAQRRSARGWMQASRWH